MKQIDMRTGRPYGDHGSANDALDFALDWGLCSEPDTFLRAWRDGSAVDEWPEFYSWLFSRELNRQLLQEGNFIRNLFILGVGLLALYGLWVMVDGR